MTEEQLKAITEKMESLFQERWVTPARKMIDAMNTIDVVLKENIWRFRDHGIHPNKYGHCTGSDPVHCMDMSLRFSNEYTNMVIERRHESEIAASISAMIEPRHFIEVFTGCRYGDIENFVSHTWASNTDLLLKLKDFLEKGTEEYFKVMASVVEAGSSRVAKMVNTCNEAECRASNILLKEFDIGTEVKKAKVLKITVEEVEG